MRFALVVLLVFTFTSTALAGGCLDPCLNQPNCNQYGFEICKWCGFVSSEFGFCVIKDNPTLEELCQQVTAAGYADWQNCAASGGPHNPVHCQALVDWFDQNCCPYSPLC